uniref:I/LWEQ domain-containing protein n=1 Tax=Mola mola TaxID=94237 RepID=A0A3Q4B3P7_MOLML
TSSETPLKEKYACDAIIMGTHKEGGASTFWSYTLNLPLSSNSMISWKFCYLLHKLLRDGHKNGNLHDRYGHIVALSAKYLCLKIEFHAKLDANGAKSTTPAGQCRLTPLIPLILDCSFLYHFSVLLMFKLHSIAPDVLLGHRERFRDLFTRWVNKMEFFKSIIQIPDLPDAPPNFLRAAALGEYKKPVVVMPGEEPYEDEDGEPQPEIRESPQVCLHESQRNIFQMCKEIENDSLKRELEVLKPELQLIKSEVSWCVTELKAQVNRLEAEVEEQRTHKQMAMVESEHLRLEVDSLRSASVAGVGAQIGLKEADSKAHAAEVRFSQLKERHAELITSHADLMKKVNCPGARVSFALLCKKILETDFFSFFHDEEDRHHSHICTINMKPLQLSINISIQPLASESFKQVGLEVSSSLAALQAERDVLLRSAREKDAEISSLRQQAQQQQGSQDLERDRLNRELEALRAQLHVKCHQHISYTEAVADYMLTACISVVYKYRINALKCFTHQSSVCSSDYLVNRAEITLTSLDKLQQNASGLLRAVTQFSHLAADTIVNTAATSHSAPTDQADRLIDCCRDCANSLLQFLKDLKLQGSLPRADPSAVRYMVQRIHALGEDLRPKGRDVLKEELGYMVDKEMVTTSTAIEEAVLRMDAKKDTCGIKLEVNQSILGSCSDLMKVMSPTLFKHISGAASVTEFYAKNSCWTEGLISASKAVGWGATQLLDSADRVVGENGRYEELIASSHEIAASTAQLVAASKVKVLQLETQLEQERVRLGELRKRHYDLAGWDGVEKHQFVFFYWGSSFSNLVFEI